MHASFASTSTFRRSFSLTILPILALLLVFSFGCAQKNNNKFTYRPKPVSPYSANQKRVNNILKTAFSQLGNPYRYGGNTPETGFDCSGFVGWVYKQFGVSLPRSSRAMMTAGVPIEKEDLRPGDLVFFNYGYSHVGIYTGDNKYIHSPRTGKSITESDLNGRGRKEHFVGARRVIDNQGITSISERLKTEWIAQSRHQARLALEKANPKRGQIQVASSRQKPTTQAKKSSRASGSVVNIKVASGDTLVGLAKKYGVTTAELEAANNLRNRHKLKLGQTINVPQKATKKANQTAKATQATKKSSLTAKATPADKKVTQTAKKATQADKNLTAKVSDKTKTKAKVSTKSQAKSKAKSQASSKKSVTKKTLAKKSATNTSAKSGVKLKAR
ncbi:MAG: C40 family peptidase [Deltaproteobacteria bacterium]|jgi:LysM repeat protein|nr:C40 family peptidase [Deltaproteobacteria bacterium]